MTLAESGAAAGAAPSALGAQLLILGKQLDFDDAALEGKVRAALEARLCDDGTLGDAPSHVELLLDVFVRTHSGFAACAGDLVRIVRSLADAALAAAPAASGSESFRFNGVAAQRVVRALQVANYCLANCGLGGGAAGAEAVGAALAALPTTLFMPALALSDAPGCAATQRVALRRWALSCIGVHCCALQGGAADGAAVAAATEQLLSAARAAAAGAVEEASEVRIWATKALMDMMLFFPDCLDDSKSVVIREFMCDADDAVASVATEGACTLATPFQSRLP